MMNEEIKESIETFYGKENGKGRKTISLKIFQTLSGDNGES